MGGDDQVGPDCPRHSSKDPHNKRFGCLFCCYRFRHYRQLEEHMHTHTKERPHHCDKCDLFFSAGKSLWEHSRVYHLGKKWKCVVCEKEFTSTSGLSLHKKTHHRKVEEEEQEQGISSAFRNAAWKAISCINGEGEKTQVEEEDEETASEVTPPPKKKLKLLLKKETKSVGLKVKRKWVCDICGKSFRRVDDYSLKRHKRTVHRDLNAANVSTPVVASEIISVGELPQPEVAKNTIVQTKNRLEGSPVPEQAQKICKKGKRVWTCEICNKKFLRCDNYSLKRHLRTVHRDVNQTISSSGSQWSQPHQQTLEKSKGKTKLLTSRNRHLRRRKTVAGDPCPFCGKLFTRLDSVYRHIERFHSEEEQQHSRDGDEEDPRQKQVDQEEEEEENDNDDEEQVVVQEMEEECPKSSEELFSDAPIHLNLHPPCSVPFFNLPPAVASDPPQPKKEWDPSFFLHMNRYDPKKDAESLNPPPQQQQQLAPSPENAQVGSKTLYKCDKCGHTMAHKWSLQRHQKRDRCTAPKKMFQTPALPTLRYVCAFCNYDFNDRRAHLVRHLSCVHRFGDETHSQKQAAPQSSSSSHSRKVARSDFSCVYCNERTGTKDKMQVHIARNHTHLLGIPREDHSSNPAEHENQSLPQTARQPQVPQPSPPPPAASSSVELQVACDIIDLSDSSLSSSMGSSLIEITDDPHPHPPPPSSPYPSESDESIEFIEELERVPNVNPPPPPNPMESESQALTELVDSQQNTQDIDIDTVLPSSSSLASQETQEISPLSLAQAIQLGRELGAQTFSSTTTSSGSQSTAPSSPASVVSESELETTLDEDVVSPAIPPEDTQDFHNFKVDARKDDNLVQIQPTTSSSSGHLTVASSSSSEKDSTSPEPPPQQVAFEKEVETIIEALLPLVSRFDYDNQIVSSEMVELETEVNTEKVQQLPITINHADHSGCEIVKKSSSSSSSSPAIHIPDHVHSSTSPPPPPPIPKILTEDLSPHSPDYAVASPVSSELNLKSPFEEGMSSELSITGDGNQFPVVSPVQPITSICQVELPVQVESTHLVNSSPSLITLENIHDPSSLPQPIQHLLSSLSPPQKNTESPPFPPPPSYLIIARENVESISIHSEEEEEEELCPPSQLEFPVTVAQTKSTKPPQSPPNNLESGQNSVHISQSCGTPAQEMELDTAATPEHADVSTSPSISKCPEPPYTSPQGSPEHIQPIPESSPAQHDTLPGITLIEEESQAAAVTSPVGSPLLIISQSSPPNSPSSSIEIIDECVESPQKSPHVIPQDEMERGDDPIFERVDVDTPPSVPEHVESPRTPSPPDHVHPMPDNVGSPPTQHATLPVIPLNEESSPQSVRELEQSTPNSPSSSSIQITNEPVPSPKSSSPASGVIPKEMEQESPVLDRFNSPPSTPQQVESPQVLPESPPEHVDTIPETYQSTITQNSTLPEITPTSELIHSAPTPQSLPLASHSITELEQSTCSNSPSKCIQVIDEYIESPQESPPSSPLINPEKVEESGGLPILEHADSPASIPEYVESPPQTPPLPMYQSPSELLPASPSSNDQVHPILETEESPLTEHDTLPVVTINQESTPSSITPELKEPDSFSELPPHSAKKLEDSTSNSPSQVLIQIIDEYNESPQTSQPSSPQKSSKQVEPSSAIPQQTELCDSIPIVERDDDTPPSIPEHVETSPQTPPQIPPEDFYAIIETVEPPPPIIHLEASTSNSVSPSSQLIIKCNKSPQTSPTSSPPINHKPKDSDPLYLKDLVESPPPSIPQTVESSPIPRRAISSELEETSQSLPISSESVEFPVVSQSSSQAITETAESTQKSPSSLSSIQIINERTQSPQALPSDAILDVDAPSPIPEQVESPPPYSEAELEESPSKSFSPFIQIIDECDKSPPMEVDPPPFREPLESPPSIPEYVESTPQTPPSPPQHVHIILKTLESPATQCDTLLETSTSSIPVPSPIDSCQVPKITPLEPVSTPSIEQLDNEKSPTSSAPPPSIDEDVESQQQSIPSSLHINSDDEKVDSIPEHLEHSPPSVPEYVESPPQTPPPPKPIPDTENEGDTPKTSEADNARSHKTRSVRKKPPVRKSSPVVTRNLGYFCHLCPLSFEPTARGKYHLSRHLAGIHRHENRRLKFACIFCGIEDSIKDTIQRHILHSHKDLLKLTNNSSQKTEEEDSSPPPPTLQRMDEHVVQEYEEDGEDDQLSPPVLLPFQCS